MSTELTVARSYFPGMGEAVADRTVNRNIFSEEEYSNLPNTLKLNPNDPDFAIWMNSAQLSEHPYEISESAKFMGRGPELRRENWEDVALRVAVGNASLVKDSDADQEAMLHHLRQASLLMSGRHLQHGDSNQAKRPMEVFTNCSTSAATFILFYLLLNGSGVGRAYDDAMIKVDFRNLPKVIVAIDENYPDRTKTVSEWDDASGEMRNVSMIPDCPAPEQVMDEYIGRSDATWHIVEDSRGGWAKALEIMERMAFEKRREETLILDFSNVREHGSPIRGMQNRPSSGPGPIMKAIVEIAKLREGYYEPWHSAMIADHHAAACVVVGGARRAARMATKTWRDPGIFNFINIKRNAGLWSSNNSVTIDDEFRERTNRVGALIKSFDPDIRSPKSLMKVARDFHLTDRISDVDLHAWKVLVEISDASYHHGTGEPGIINQDRLTVNDEGIEAYIDGLFAESSDYRVDFETRPLMKGLAEAVCSARYSMIVNPCGEIALLMLGAYCVIADVVPFHTQSDEDAEDAFRVAVRALMRTNTMDCLYKREVTRTNRIGVGMTGFHEWAYDRFGMTWKDLVNEAASKELWLTVARFKRAVVDEAKKYAEILGVAVPHTNTTFKPAGTTSKLFGLSEGAHLPSMRWFLRWVQFRSDDPLIQDYAAKGYPTMELKSYAGTTVVGFPTAPAICELDGGDWVTTAAEATPEEQYEYLRLLEKYWIRGVEEDGETPLEESGNQVSYTLKYDPEVVDFGTFFETLMEGQFSIRCCSVMPQTDTSGYEYQPEEPISHERYLELMSKIDAKGVKEDIGMEHVDCSSGACPIDFNNA